MKVEMNCGDRDGMRFYLHPENQSDSMLMWFINQRYLGKEGALRAYFNAGYSSGKIDSMTLFIENGWVRRHGQSEEEDAEPMPVVEPEVLKDSHGAAVGGGE